MKKFCLLSILLFSLLETGFAQSSVVHLSHISADYTATPNPTVTFEVYWDDTPDNNRHLDSVWLFVDYQLVNIDGTTGSWTPATLGAATATSPGTVIQVPSNERGFYLRGTAATFSSTVTVPLKGLPVNPKFNWCAYATDYPPNATIGDGYYALHGSPPFVVNGSTLTDGVRTYTGCITQLTDATGCPGFLPVPPEVLSFSPSTPSICYDKSLTLNATATGAASYSFDGGHEWIASTTSASTVVAPTTNTTYTVHVTNAAGCTATYPTNVSVTVHPLPAATFSNAPSTACAGSTVTLTVGDGSGSYCFTQSCSACKHNPYDSGNDVDAQYECTFDSGTCTFVSSNTYSVTLPDSGRVEVCVKVINANGCIDSSCIFIEAIPLPTPVLSGGGTFCNGAATLTCPSVSSASYQLQTYGITPVAVGTPRAGIGAPLTFTLTDTDSGTYTVTATNAAGCTAVSDPQAVTIGYTPTITLTSAAATDDQRLSANHSIIPITYATTNATGAVVTGLPANVTGVWNNNVYTISGLPPSGLVGTFTYTVSTTNNNGCPNDSQSGTITLLSFQHCYASALTLPGVGFTSSTVYTINQLIVSSPVTVTWCDKTDFSTNAYVADCRNNSIYGHSFNACMVVLHPDKLCPAADGWRVPTSADFCKIATNSESPCADVEVSTQYAGMNGWLLGGYYHPQNNSLMAEGSIGYYWSSTEHNSNAAYMAEVWSNKFFPQEFYNKGYGLTLRCVKDAP